MARKKSVTPSDQTSDLEVAGIYDNASGELNLQQQAAVKLRENVRTESGKGSKKCGRGVEDLAFK